MGGSFEIGSIQQRLGRRVRQWLVALVERRRVALGEVKFGLDQRYRVVVVPGLFSGVERSFRSVRVHVVIYMAFHFGFG